MSLGPIGKFYHVPKPDLELALRRFENPDAPEPESLDPELRWVEKHFGLPEGPNAYYNKASVSYNTSSANYDIDVAKSNFGANIPGYEKAPHGTFDNTGVNPNAPAETPKPENMMPPVAYYNSDLVRKPFNGSIPKPEISRPSNVSEAKYEKAPRETVNNTGVSPNAPAETPKPGNMMTPVAYYNKSLAESPFRTSIPKPKRSRSQEDGVLRHPQPQRTSPYSPVDRSSNVSPLSFNDNVPLSPDYRNFLERSISPSNE